MNRNKFRDIIESLIEEIIEEDDIEEATVTGDIEGYSTPFAFTGNTSASKKRKRRISTNSTGYEPVKEEIKLREIIRKIIKNRRQ